MQIRHRSHSRIFGLVILIFVVPLAAVGATLNVGDSAPPLHTGKWLKGEPVSKFAEGTAYLVEFWASWSPSARDSAPRINDIHQKFKDKGLIIFGQNCWERDESAGNFVKELKITYAVALDDEDRSMAKNWMSTAGQSSLPTTFLID